MESKYKKKRKLLIFITVQAYKYKIRILWFIKANNQEFCDFIS